MSIASSLTQQYVGASIARLWPLSLRIRATGSVMKTLPGR
jgi:hypothetical protein